MSWKNWCRVGAIAVLSLVLSTTVAVAEDHGHGHDKHDRDDDDHGNGHGKGHDKDQGQGYYSDHDRDIHDWYRAHHSDLPPGLAKRDRLSPGLERQIVVRGTLPPGLQNKMQPCPRELEMMLPPPRPNYAHVIIGGNLVLVNRADFQIADVFHIEIH